MTPHRNLLIRVGKNLTDGHRYIVALRNLKKADGSAIEAPAGFRLYRDTTRTDNDIVEERREHFESIFSSLEKAGIARDSLYLAWDFTVASTENITGRMLSIRNRAFADLGDTNLTDGNGRPTATHPPSRSTRTTASRRTARTASSTSRTATGNGVQNIRQVNGTFTVPCYLNQPGCPPGSVFNLDGNQLPIRTAGNNMTAKFRCNIPRSAVAPTAVAASKSTTGAALALRARAVRRPSEVNSTRHPRARHENGVMTCGTDFSGMADEDVLPLALPGAARPVEVPALPDRLQQGFLNFLFLGRLMIHEDGFTADAAVPGSAARRASTRATSSTTATARAASPVAA